MNIWDILILFAVGALILAAVIVVSRSRSKGCSCGCGGCSENCGKKRKSENNGNAG